MSTATGAVRTHTDSVDPKDMRVIWLLLIAAFVAILNETTMGIAIPHLNADLGLAPELGQWLTSAFLLTMAVVIPTTGFLIERLTTRQLYLAAMGAFSLGTLICLVAPGFLVLLIGRVMQALGTGVMLPLLMTTVMNVVPANSRGRIMGRLGLVISLAPAVGPVLSGAVLDSLSWRWLFAIVLPIALVVLVIGAKWMTNLGETVVVPLDVLSVILSALAFGGIVFGLSSLGEGASRSAIAAVSLGVGGVFLAVFIWRQLRLQQDDRALLDLRVFRSRNYAISVGILAIVSLGMFGTLTLLPQYLQNVVQLDTLMSGLILLPGSVLMGLLGPLIGRVYDSVGPKPLLIPGTILVAGVLFFYSTVTEHTPWPVLMAVQSAMFIGMAASFTPIFSSAMGSLDKHLYPHGSAVLNTLQQVAGAAGVAVLVVTYSTILHRGEAHGLATAAAGAPGARMAFLIAAIVSLVAVALSFFVRRPADSDGAEHFGH
ncbi:MAG: MDR family MFS transporter [Microbacterium sp.]